MEEIQLQVVLSFKGKPVLCKIFIRDGIAMSFFTKKEIAHMIYENEVRLGNKNIHYDQLEDAVIEDFPKMTKEEILVKIKEEIMKGGGKEI
jgi:adenine-specific DNA methylase